MEADLLKEVAALARTVIGSTLIITYALLIAVKQYGDKVGPGLRDLMYLAGAVCLLSTAAWLVIMVLLLRQD